MTGIGDSVNDEQRQPVRKSTECEPVLRSSGSHSERLARWEDRRGESLRRTTPSSYTREVGTPYDSLLTFKL
jgi:hypothetical protein